MSSFSVAIHFDILKDFRIGILSVLKGAALQQLTFKAVEQGFHKGVIIDVIHPAHALQQMVFYPAVFCKYYLHTGRLVFTSLFFGQPTVASAKAYFQHLTQYLKGIVVFIFLNEAAYRCRVAD